MRPNKFEFPRDEMRNELSKARGGELVPRHIDFLIAGLADCDVRTFRDYVTGRRNPRSAQCAQIERVLRDLGLKKFIRQQAVA